MLVLELIVAAIVVFFVCAYFKLPVLWWTIAYGAIAVLTENVPPIVAFAIVAAVLNVSFFRRILVTNHVLAVYRRILPDMSPTEKEAIDAGTVWWDADLFSGKPEWDKLLAVPQPRLSAEDQAFLHVPDEKLGTMCADCEITHDHQDLS